ncbi:hypothetical protein RHS01_11257 [Rhizoctonia solani]|uniref:CCHC-type domain-containing protein n=1 Tax=Rhizoctonia solani TaxID=456999 RepID=A0A8H7I072_9AGAM|nr:hypothetical protein RHS01_11257 [Rhizoctonia solani]
MATRSWSTACPQSPLDQGELGPTLQATADESGSLKPEVYGEISLSRAISLLLGLQNQVIRLKRELKEIKEVNKEAQDWMGAVNQTLTCIKASNGPNPTHQKTGNHPAIKATPRPLSKANPLPAPSAPLVAWANPTKPPLPLPNQLRSGPPQESKLPLHLCLSGSALPLPLSQRLQEDWEQVTTMAHKNDGMGPPQPAHVPNGSGGHHPNGQGLQEGIPAAFGTGRYKAAAERQITHLTQTGTCAEYITKFRTIAMDLDWNDAAFVGSLHAASTGRGASTGQQATRPGRLSSDPNFVSKEEQNRRRAKGLCIKCGKLGHKFAECHTGWKATPKEEGVKKEAAKVGKESGPELGKD